MVLAVVLTLGWAIWGGSGENAPEVLLSAKNNVPDNGLTLVQDNSLMAVGPIIFPRAQVLGIITMYNPVPEQTDDSPNITASGDLVEEGMVANNCLEFGTWVEIDNKSYQVFDRMNKRYSCQYYDILSFDLEEAKNFGKKETEVIIYK